jgi:hypothetical protein
VGNLASPEPEARDETPNRSKVPNKRMELQDYQFKLESNNDISSGKKGREKINKNQEPA